MSSTFTAEEFKKAFRPHLFTWAASWSLLMGSALISILLLLRSQNWQFPSLIHTSTLTIGNVLAIKLFDVSANAVGLFAVGINIVGLLGMGVNAYGLFAVGVNAIGIFAVGANAVGVFAVGINAVGLFAVGINAVGRFAMGYCAFGIYALSYNQKGKGRYLFSPIRQDAEAVALFTHWMPEFEGAFNPTP